MFKKLFLLCYSFVLSLFINAPAQAAEDFDRQEILERIQPIGQVRLEQGSQTQKAPEEAQQTAKKEPGQEIFDQYCHVCHQTGVAGAPKTHNKEDWKPRMAAMNLEALTASAEKGKNAMPPKGTCSECTHEQIKQAIQYMLPK